MSFIKQYLYLRGLVFKEDADAYELLTIALAFSVLWAVIFELTKPAIRRVSYGKPWLRAACEREYDSGGKEQIEGLLGKEMTKEEVIHKMMIVWADWQVLYLQHLTGAALCVPSLIGYGDPNWAASLAVCGVLSEMGWEIYDMTNTLRRRFLTKNGAEEVSMILILVSAFHHSLTSTLAVPMALHYRNSKAFHSLCFDLQMGAGAGVMTEYSKTLDIKNPKQLRQLKVVNLLLLAICAWTRIFHWAYNVYTIMCMWYNDEAWTFIYIGLVPVLLFTVFSAVVMVIPTYKRFMKFISVSAEYESLPSDAPIETRRQSIMNLQDAIDELLMEETDITMVLDRRVGEFLDSLEQEDRAKLERRRSMPNIRTKRVSARLMKTFSVRDSAWKID